MKEQEKQEKIFMKPPSFLGSLVTEVHIRTKNIIKPQ